MGGGRWNHTTGLRAAHGIRRNPSPLSKFGALPRAPDPPSQFPPRFEPRSLKRPLFVTAAGTPASTKSTTTLGTPARAPEPQDGGSGDHAILDRSCRSRSGRTRSMKGYLQRRTFLLKKGLPDCTGVRLGVRPSTPGEGSLQGIATPTSSRGKHRSAAQLRPYHQPGRYTSAPAFCPLLASLYVSEVPRGERGRRCRLVDWPTKLVRAQAEELRACRTLSSSCTLKGS